MGGAPTKGATAGCELTLIPEAAIFHDEPVGPDEQSDPEHLAGSLVRLLADTPGQEVGSHTFSHFYCLEQGQHEVDLRADLAAARSIARLYGLELTSLVLPRNQWKNRRCCR